MEDAEAPRVVGRGRAAGLHVTAVLLDDITCVYNFIEVGDPAGIQSWAERACRELGGTPYPHTGETILHAALRTATLDAAHVSEEGFARRPDSLDALVNLPVGDIIRKLFCADASMDVEAGVLRETCREMTKWRRFAVTHGGFIGLVPYDVRVGDQVFAFAGGSVLYVARQAAGLVSTRYTFVGESYFHGLMDGEWRSNDSFGSPYRAVLV
ncbi:hypothetical protein OQA88_8991 [Cercophora sp. LCS_1]